MPHAPASVRRFLAALAALTGGGVVLPALPLAPLGALEAQGRPLTVNAQRDVAFGNLLPGVPTDVSPADALRAGQFELRAPRNAQLEVTFLLPNALAGPAGATLPLAFGPGSAGYSHTGGGSGLVLVDPRVPFTLTTVNTNGRVYVFLGATARPGGQQRPGAYGGTVTVTIAHTGL